MDSQKPNIYSVFDAPVRLKEKERVVLTPEDIERQLDAGAFVMTREDAVAAGFLSPHEEPDTVIVDVREGV